MTRSFAYRVLGIVILMMASLLGFADTGTIEIQCVPGISVADGISTITVLATVRDRNGNLVADGTQVVFRAVNGKLSEEIVTTNAGVARNILTTGTTPGKCVITASVLTGAVATSEYNLTLVSDASMLSSAKEYVEIFSPDYLMYSPAQAIVAASDEKQQAELRYREITIHAADLQYRMNSGDVLAKRATVKIGKFEHKFDEVLVNLASRSGKGVAQYKSTAPVLIPFGRGMIVTYEEVDDYGPVTFTAGGMSELPTGTIMPRMVFADFGEETSTISARKVVVYPNKEIQVHKAEIYYQGSKVVKQQLMSINLRTGRATMFTDELVNVNDTTISIQYPHYLSLRPGQSSLIRFRTGERYGRSSNATRGLFLDYELKWNKGDDMEGSLTVSGLARDDWGLGIRQFYKFDNRTTAYGIIDMPANSSLFGSLNLNRRFDGFQTSVNANFGTNLKGTSYRSQSLSMVAESYGIRAGKAPVKLYPGVRMSNSYTQNSATAQSQSAVGVQLRSVLLPQRVDSKTAFNASLTVAHLSGRNTLRGITYYGNAVATRQLSKEASITASYDYVEDGYSSNFLGKHRFSMYANMWSGRSNASFSAYRSLGVDRLSLLGDMGYRLNNEFRLAYLFTYERYIGQSFLDKYLTVAYRLAGTTREFGLTYNWRTRRVGIQFLGSILP